MADGPDEVRKICRLLVREGTDLFKLNVSGHAGPTDHRTDRAVMTDAEVGAAMDVARANGVRVCAHARSADSVKMCIRHGLGIIYHANFADEEALDQLEANRDWCFVVPALGLAYQACHAGSEWGFTPERVRERGLLRQLEVSVETMGLMRKRGIRVLPGGDYGFAWNPHGTYARDLPALRRRARLHAHGDARRGHAGWAARSWAVRTSSARSSPATSPTSCWSTAIRSPTSSACKTATRS